MTYDDLNDHPFAVFQAGENYVSLSERRWLKWVAACERALGHSLDGDQTEDGYSLDYAYAAWEAGASVAQYVAEVREAV